MLANQLNSQLDAVNDTARPLISIDQIRAAAISFPFCAEFVEIDYHILNVHE